MAQAHAQPKYMTFGEGGLAFALALLAIFSIVVAAKAYTPAYAFHAYLFAAASVASVFAILNRFFERDAAPPPLTIDGKPNYNMGPVKLATILAVFWGIAGFTVGLYGSRSSWRSRSSISTCRTFRSGGCARCTPRPSSSPSAATC